MCQMRFASVDSAQESGELREPAKVAIVNARDPVPNDLTDRIAKLLDDEWLVDELFGKPTVAIIVTGGAQNFEMLPRVERVFREGLVKAARMTNAWVFTGGSASGCMKYVGEALASHPDIPCIGMPVFGNVLGSEQIKKKVCSLADMRDNKEQMVEYVHGESDNSLNGAALEPNHTHFILIDNGEKGPNAWGTEIEFGLDVQLAYCAHEEGNRVPAVLLVVQGGPGTLRTVVSAVKRGVPVVVIVDSGGCASAIHNFLTRSKEEELEISKAEGELELAEAELITARAAVDEAAAGLPLKEASAAHMEARINWRRAKQRRERAEMSLHVLEQKLLRSSASVQRAFSPLNFIRQLRELREKKKLIQLFELAHNATADISQSILSAVACDQKLEEHKMLELAIVWNNSRMIGNILAQAGKQKPVVASGRDDDKATEEDEPSTLWDSARYNMQAALQLALELQQADVVAMLLSNGADIGCVLLSRLYLLPEKNKFRLFSQMQTTARREVQEWLKADTKVFAPRLASRISSRVSRGAGATSGGVGWLSNMLRGPRISPAAAAPQPLAVTVGDGAGEAAGSLPPILRRVASEKDAASAERRNLLFKQGILDRAQLSEIQTLNARFVRSARIFKPFIEEWVDADSHGMTFDTEAHPGKKLLQQFAMLSPKRGLQTSGDEAQEGAEGTEGAGAHGERFNRPQGAGLQPPAHSPGNQPALPQPLDSFGRQLSATAEPPVTQDPSSIPQTGCRIEDLFIWCVNAPFPGAAFAMHLNGTG